LNGVDFWDGNNRIRETGGREEGEEGKKLKEFLIMGVLFLFLFFFFFAVGVLFSWGGFGNRSG